MVFNVYLKGQVKNESSWYIDIKLSVFIYFSILYMCVIKTSPKSD